MWHRLETLGYIDSLTSRVHEGIPIADLKEHMLRETRHQVQNPEKASWLQVRNSRPTPSALAIPCTFPRGTDPHPVHSPHRAPSLAAHCSLRAPCLGWLHCSLCARHRVALLQVLNIERAYYKAQFEKKKLSAIAFGVLERFMAQVWNTNGARKNRSPAHSM